MVSAGLSFILPYSFGFVQVHNPIARMLTDFFAHIELILSQLHWIFITKLEFKINWGIMPKGKT